MNDDALPESMREHIESDPYCEMLGIDLVTLEEGFTRTELDIREEL